MARRRVQAGNVFIHFADPSFPDPPWPGERRLGPYLTVDEATAQAINDVAHGHIAEDALIGVFTEEESLKRKDVLRTRWNEHGADNPNTDPYDPPPAFDPRDYRAGKAEVIPSTICKRAVTARKQLLARRAEGIAEQTETLQQMLPPGVSVTDLIESAGNPDALAKLLTEQP